MLVTLKKLFQALLLTALALTFSTPTIADNEDGVPVEDTGLDACKACVERIQFFANGYLIYYECAPLAELQTEGITGCRETTFGCTGDNSCTVYWV